MPPNVSDIAPLSPPRSPRRSSRSARCTPHAIARRRGRRRCRCSRAPDGDARRCSAPVPPSSPTSSASTCSRVLELTRGHRQGRRGRRRCPVPLGARERRPALGAAGRRGRAAAPPTSGAPAPRWPGRPATGQRGHLDPRARPTTAASRRSSSARCSGRSRFHWRSGAPEHRPVGRVVLADVPDDAELADALDRARRDRRRRLARPDAGHRAVQHQEPAAGWPTRPRRSPRRPASSPRSGTRSSSRPTGFGGILGVGQASATPPRLIRLDYTPDKGARQGRRTSCWSARASPSTPAASRSSPPRRWST